MPRKRRSEAAPEVHIRPENPADPRITDYVLPPSWADERFHPPELARCSACKGDKFWADPNGWRCVNCHPQPDAEMPQIARATRGYNPAK